MILKKEDRISEVKPFLKWAGGKHRLFERMKDSLPNDLLEGKIKHYYEPFLGGGAMCLKLIQRYKLESVVLSDINEELILAYEAVKRDAPDILEYFDIYKKRYDKLSEKDKEKYFYDMRSTYNINRFNVNHKKYSDAWIPRAAQMIFLNKTCYNGLFRQNLSGEFNVPFGKNYEISFDESNLLNASKILNYVELRCGDFTTTCADIPTDSFVYFDPPYTPSSSTAKFTHYYRTSFNNNDHIRLSKLIKDLDSKGVKIMLSNSFPSQIQHDGLMSEHYAGYNCEFINVSRTMPSIITKRGKIKEILITNY